MISKKTRYSSAEERLTPSPNLLTSDGPTGGWLSAHNREVVGSKPTAGTSPSQVHSLVLTKIPRSAAEARRKTPSSTLYLFRVVLKMVIAL